MLPGAAGKSYSCREAGCLAGAGSLEPGILHGACPACLKRLPERARLPRLGSLERELVAVTAELSSLGLGGLVRPSVWEALEAVQMEKADLACRVEVNCPPHLHFLLAVGSRRPCPAHPQL